MTCVRAHVRAHCFGIAMSYFLFHFFSNMNYAGTSRLILGCGTISASFRGCSLYGGLKDAGWSAHLLSPTQPYLCKCYWNSPLALISLCRLIFSLRNQLFFRGKIVLNDHKGIKSAALYFWLNYVLVYFLVYKLLILYNKGLGFATYFILSKTWNS